MGLIEEENDEKELVDQDKGVFYGIEKLNIEANDRPLSPPMYLSTGFGMVVDWEWILWHLVLIKLRIFTRGVIYGIFCNLNMQENKHIASHLLAAYARFLWEIDDGRYEDIASTNDIQIEDKISVELPNSSQEKPVSPPLNLAAGLIKDANKSGVHVGNTVYSSKPPTEGVDIENYYKRMVEENY
ncbi:hypothetical protein POM88_018875 [Heracleum sosnowskyi]|uniref:Uncharacterized protein n=1 Tax=Heracleum sosnowskyi TaxID=360622 RepID=A0AAD8IRB8_9APIA|nr:hypothetical protein POM88_018875 [Heracleum sosnowskyi]